ncbi:MAG: hypothetical protein UR46_C0009G0003 [Parcubacteria group bacterium GW2011_GWA1_33_6]|uniref:DUF5667 domain-containing protein n=1 Tax=Candidatus Staskawiczbacteria bacterium RIFCSPHIGHO2_02_FULL_33_16 TaxID=1802204 RepID=A0A1G2HXU8_9BACT|nr:MAG: hypothetical protein UR46_C0009G0003 [Parcubacteria group bacterium GW2011_GWA1_33_6]OGZ66648.1 MAG: hypothetical protein A3D34_00090 [Candidatus Staskawiczbacteria bacterium RIFCSPHIGHO2_02_FULL_33_16]
MTEQELIAKLQSLKQVKPRKEWVFSIRMQILESSLNASKIAHKTTYKERFLNVFQSLYALNLQKKLAYSFAVFLFFAVGALGVMTTLLPNNDSKVNITEQSPDALVAIKDSVETFKTKSQNLIDVTKNNPQDFSLAIKEVKNAAKTLTEAIEKDPELAKEIALEVKNNVTLLSVVSEAELEEASGNLCRTIVEPVIKDLEQTTLTEVQHKELVEMEGIYDEDKYSDNESKCWDVLEKILLINSVK